METIFPDSVGLTEPRRIGEGGSGVVYAATHASLGKVAVKVAVDNCSSTRRLFETEYTLLRSLDHPGIIRLWDYGLTPDRRPYIVMELLSGGDLYSFADQLPMRGRFRPLGNVLSALQFLHNVGIVHRDLKGENILLGDTGNSKITDLGLATSSGDRSSGRGGTIEYMAPEVIDNRGASVASDIYSLGVILYRLATSRLPFSSDDPLQVISLKQEPDSLTLRELAAATSPRFVDAVRRCLDPNPGKRFKSVGELSEQLVLDRLLQKVDLPPQKLQSYFHHHIWSYNTSFVRQELRRFDRNYEINDHYQEPAAHLFEVIADHLKTNGCKVEQGSQRETLVYEGSDDQKHSVTLARSAVGSGDKPALEYRELDRFAFDALLAKLFPAGYDLEMGDLLSRYSSGNSKLLHLLLSQLEQESLLNARAGGLDLHGCQPWLYQPSRQYYETLAQMIPDLGEELQETVAFLAADPFDHPRDQWMNQGRLSLSHLRWLAELDILREHDFQFSRSYFREYFYWRIPPSRRPRIHREWIEHLHQEADLDKDARDEQLFYHLASASCVEEALETVLRLADSLRQGNKPQRARQFLARARALPSVADYSSPYRRLLMTAADLAKDTGDFNQALSDYARLIWVATRANDKALVAEAYKDLGDVYKGKRDYRRGNRVLDRAVKLYGDLGDELELSHCFNNIGNIYWIKGDLANAEVNYETALEVQRNLGAHKDIASTLNNLGSIKSVRQKFDEAIKLYEESIAIKREIKDYPELARTMNNIAVAYTDMDELQIAKEYLEESVQINRSLKAEKELIVNYENFYEIELRRGNYQQVREWVFAALRLSRRNDYSQRGVFVTALANLALLQGEYGRAGSLLAAASRCEQQVTDQLLSIKVASLMAEYCRLLHDCQNAERYLSMALEHSDRLDELKMKAQLLINRSRLERVMGKPEATILSTYRMVEEILERLPVKREKVSLLLDETEYYLEVARLEDAVRAFARARSFPSFEGANTLQPQISYLSGVIESRRANFSKATTLLHDAMIGAKALSMRELVWRSLAALGDAYQNANEYERAFKCYIEAFTFLKQLAAGIANQRLKSLYLSDREKARVAEKLEEMSQLAG